MNDEEIRLYADVELTGEFEFTFDPEEIERAIPEDAEIDVTDVVEDEAIESARDAAIEAIEARPNEYITIHYEQE